MRIVVNNIAASQGGALTILRQFYEYVKEHCHEDEWIFLLGNEYLEETSNIKIITLPQIKRSHFRKIFFDCVSGRYFINRLKPDRVLSLQNIVTFGIKAPQTVYIHQSIPFQTIRNFSFFNSKERGLAFIQKVIGQFIIFSARSANTVIVQTKWMREAVAVKSGVKCDKIIVARPNMEKMPSLDSPPQFSPKLFFYPTADSLYKNNEMILKACQLLNQQGINDFQVTLTLPPGRITHPNIVCCGYLDKKALCVYYHQSVLLFPSYIETIGLPLLEGRSLGIPVIASDCQFARDSLTGYPNAFYFSPFDPSALAKQMYKAMTKPAQRFSSQLFNETSAIEWGKVIDAIQAS